MKPPLLVSLALLLSCLPLMAQSRIIEGNWQDANDPGKQIWMRVRPDGAYYGEVMNDRSKISRNGLLVFSKLTWDATTRTYRGTLINPDGNDTFAIVVTMDTPGSFTFRVKRFFMTRTFRFVRLPS